MRISWMEYFYKITELVSLRSTCLRRQVGALAVKNNNILATGYNGAPPGFVHCIDIGTCVRETLKVPSGERHEICRAIHAEENLIIQAALHGVCLKSCDIYITHQPCVICVKKLIRLQPENLYFKNKYPDPTAIEFLSGYFDFIDRPNHRNLYHLTKRKG